MAIEKELLDQLLEGRDPETVFTQDGLLDELMKGLSERVRSSTRILMRKRRMEKPIAITPIAEDGAHGYVDGDAGYSTPRAGTFDPQLIANTSAGSRTS